MISGRYARREIGGIRLAGPGQQFRFGPSWNSPSFRYLRSTFAPDNKKM